MKAITLNSSVMLRGYGQNDRLHDGCGLRVDQTASLWVRIYVVLRIIIQMHLLCGATTSGVSIASILVWLYGATRAGFSALL